MCIAFLAVESDPRYPFIVLVNRDEAYDRPTEPLHRWAGEPDVWAGRDILKGGTWLGVNEYGEVAFLTNYREPQAKHNLTRTRGELPLLFLRRQADDFGEILASRGGEYPGFNLIWGHYKDLHFSSNRHPAQVAIGPGIHGLSNASLDTPWPKVELGKERLRETLSSSNFSTEDLFDILSEERPFDKKALPDTGLPIELEQALSPIKIATLESYGSVSATIVMVDNGGFVRMWEKTYASGKVKAYAFQTERRRPW
jgi:uncharacterized protein with NRDE domain